MLCVLCEAACGGERPCVCEALLEHWMWETPCVCLCMKGHGGAGCVEAAVATCLAGPWESHPALRE